MDDVIRQADSFRHKVQDYCDNTNLPQVHQFRDELQKFYNETKAHKSPDYLFNEVKRLESMVDGFKNTDGMFNPTDVHEMYKRTKELEETLRHLSSAS